MREGWCRSLLARPLAGIPSGSARLFAVVSVKSRLVARDSGVVWSELGVISHRVVSLRPVSREPPLLVKKIEERWNELGFESLSAELFREFPLAGIGLRRDSSTMRTRAFPPSIQKVSRI
jgi:hypothetical protein